MPIDSESGRPRGLSLDATSPRRRRGPSTYSARLLGKVNNGSLQVNGRGSIDQASGRVHGRYELERLPAGIHPRLLNAVMVTGYPSVCQESAGAANPFAGGSYSYTRSLDFGDRGLITYSAACRNIDEDPATPWLDSNFEISGSVEIPVLVGTAPLVETWTPVSGRRIDGCFTMSWKSECGEMISAVAQTKYLIPKGAQLPSEVLYRCIELKNQQAGNMLEIDQRSRLFSESAIRSLIYPTGA